MTQWQPIDTAPKDGTLVDLWADGRRLPDCFWGHEYDDEGDRRWHQCYAEVSHSWFVITEKPTHWAPIQEGPG